MLREVIREIVHNFFPLVFDFLPTERAQERRALVLDRVGAEGVLIIEIGYLKLSIGFH